MGHIREIIILALLWLSNSVAKSCQTICDPMNGSTPSFPVLHYLPEFAQTHVHWVSDAIQPSYPLSAFSAFALNFPSIRVFSSELALHIWWPRIGASASLSVLPMTIQGWYPLRLTGLISLLYKGPSRVFSSNTIWNHWIYASKFKVCIVSLSELLLHLL